MTMRRTRGRALVHVFAFVGTMTALGGESNDSINRAPSVTGGLVLRIEYTDRDPLRVRGLLHPQSQQIVVARESDPEDTWVENPLPRPPTEQLGRTFALGLDAGRYVLLGLRYTSSSGMATFRTDHDLPAGGIVFDIRPGAITDLGTLVLSGSLGEGFATQRIGCGTLSARRAAAVRVPSFSSLDLIHPGCVADGPNARQSESPARRAAVDGQIARSSDGRVLIPARAGYLLTVMPDGTVDSIDTGLGHRLEGVKVSKRGRVLAWGEEGVLGLSEDGDSVFRALQPPSPSAFHVVAADFIDEDPLVAVVEEVRIPSLLSWSVDLGWGRLAVYRFRDDGWSAFGSIQTTDANASAFTDGQTPFVLADGKLSRFDYETGRFVVVAERIDRWVSATSESIEVARGRSAWTAEILRSRDGGRTWLPLFKSVSFADARLTDPRPFAEGHLYLGRQRLRDVVPATLRFRRDQGTSVLEGIDGNCQFHPRLSATDSVALVPCDVGPRARIVWAEGRQVIELR